MYKFVMEEEAKVRIFGMSFGQDLRRKNMNSYSLTFYLLKCIEGQY